MKKLLSILLTLVMTVSLAACGGKTASGGSEEGKKADGKTIYVMGPTPDHGWTAQAGAYAEKRVKEINDEGTYKAQYLPASSGEEQVDQVQTIIANGDAAGVVMMALDDTAQAGQEALHAEDIPFISFDRIIEATEKYAILNYSGDNWAVGAGIAYWLLKNGMAPGDVLVTLWGDNGTVCTRRQQGFEEYLLGTKEYFDKHTGETHKIDKAWTEDEVKALTSKYSTVVDPNWSADGAYTYLETQIDAFVNDATNGSKKLYVFSQDDEMTFGLMNLLEGNAVSEDTKAKLEALDTYVSAIGGMAELYAVIDGTGAQAAVANKYFDGLMSMNFNPNMMINAINYMVDYLGGNWEFKQGDGTYSDTWVVDKDNVSQYEGFAGH
ncbi:MAG: substrate-binding domain-containing protein [Bacillota bacterium]|nr:substrate-binding domain-containing protein [Bacillota bacterium]